ncbi:MAG: DNA polymerase III subunit delta [Bacteroidales bacterium]|nr:DNA polymerase III subunit delta [Bacteroidales bacterium]
MAKIYAKDTLAATERILSDLKNKIYKPIYLLMGEEPYFIDTVSEYIANNVLTPEERGFNQLVLYGKDITVAQVIDTARRYPMMSSQQVIIVREAQQLKNFEDLEVYTKNPLTSTILVLCFMHKSVDKRKALYKSVEKTGAILETVQFYENEAVAWIKNYLNEKSCDIRPDAAQILFEHLGADLGKIVNELDKLFTLLPEGNKKITTEHIEKNIGISREYNVFELNNAINMRNTAKAMLIVEHFRKNPNEYPMVMTLSTLFGNFVKLLKLHLLQRSNTAIDNYTLASGMGIAPFFLSDYKTAGRNYPPGKTAEIIRLIREYDMRSKGWYNGAADHGDLLRELVIRIVS